jgi:hypothetical protein
MTLKTFISENDTIYKDISSNKLFKSQEDFKDWKQHIEKFKGIADEVLKKNEEIEKTLQKLPKIERIEKGHRNDN